METTKKPVIILEDSLGKVEIPADAYYGINTYRAVHNFPITHYKLHPKLIIAFALVKKAAAYANEVTLEVKAPGTYQHIISACDQIIAGAFHDQFVVDPIQGGAGTSINMNANEVIANIALEEMGYEKHRYDIISPYDHINMSQSTNDVNPTAARLCVRRLLDDLLETMHELAKIFQAKADEFDSVVKMGRTHLQDAIPIRLGQTFDAYTRVLRRDIERISKIGNHLYQVNLGATAVGTALNANAIYVKKAIDKLREVTGFEKLALYESLVDGTQNTDAFTEVSGALKISALNMSKIANDLRLMASGPRCGFAEISLKPLQPGSSIMPGKVNPILPELINQVAFQVCGNDLTVSMASEAGQFELNVMQPVLVYNLIQSVSMMNNAYKVFGEHCVKEITLSAYNLERIKSYVDNSPILATGLSPAIGYKRAEAYAKIAIRDNKTVYEVCAADEALVNELGGIEKLKQLLDADAMTRWGERMRDTL